MLSAVCGIWETKEQRKKKNTEKETNQLTDSSLERTHWWSPEGRRGGSGGNLEDGMHLLCNYHNENKIIKWGSEPSCSGWWKRVACHLCQHAGCVTLPACPSLSLGGQQQPQEARVEVALSPRQDCGTWSEARWPVWRGFKFPSVPLPTTFKVAALDFSRQFYFLGAFLNPLGQEVATE